MKAGVFAGTLLMAACAPDRPLQTLGKLPEFRMTAVGPAGEAPFTEKDMLGKVWAAEFVFTRCGGPCPLMTGRLAAMSERVPGLRVLAVTVDPAGDTAPRLREYALRHRVDPTRWVFLRGSSKDTYRLLYEGFKLPMSTQPDAPAESRVMHSTRFVLIDAQGSIRGYYDALAQSGDAALEADARKLLAAEGGV